MLDAEMDRLKQAIGMGQRLSVVWMPSVEKPLSGEVKGGEVRVYEQDEGEALQVLRHEFIDYVVTQAIEPYKMVTNALIKVVNEDAYGRKERIVEALVRLLASPSV